MRETPLGLGYFGGDAAARAHLGLPASSRMRTTAAPPWLPAGCVSALTPHLRLVRAGVAEPEGPRLERPCPQRAGTAVQAGEAEGRADRGVQTRARRGLLGEA